MFCRAEMIASVVGCDRQRPLEVTNEVPVSNLPSRFEHASAPSLRGVSAESLLDCRGRRPHEGRTVTRENDLCVQRC